VVPAVLALLFSISTTGTLPRSSLEPLFDGENAATLARTLSVEYPSRVPGSEGARQAARWYAETVRALGLTTEEDEWSEDLADLGTVRLRNVVTIVPGRSEETIVVVAHRDNAGTGRPLGDNASGTAALVELARAYAGRIGHLHLKDVDPELLARVQAGELALDEAWAGGIFCPFGEGAVDFAAVRAELDGYDGWTVLEQDRVAVTVDELAAVAAVEERNLAAVV